MRGSLVWEGLLTKSDSEVSILPPEVCDGRRPADLGFVLQT